MVDACTLPCRLASFSCDMERMLWLLRHQDEPIVRSWWLGFEWAQKGRCFDRVKFEIEHNPEIYY